MALYCGTTLDERVRNFIIDFRSRSLRRRLAALKESLRLKNSAAYDQLWTAESQELGMLYSPDDEPAERLRQLRRIQRFYGDFAHKSMQPELHAGYRRLAESAPTVHQTELRELLTASFPSGQRDVDRELAHVACLSRRRSDVRRSLGKDVYADESRG